MIDIKDFDLYQIKIDRKYQENITIYYTGYYNLDNINIHSVNYLYLNFNKVDGYIELNNENKS